MKKKDMGEAEWIMLIAMFMSVWFIMFMRFWNGI